MKKIIVLLGFLSLMVLTFPLAFGEANPDCDIPTGKTCCTARNCEWGGEVHGIVKCAGNTLCHWVTGGVECDSVKSLCTGEQ